MRGRRAWTAVALAATAGLLPLACGGHDEPAPPRPGQATLYTPDGRAVRPVPAPTSRPNLLLIVLDTLRADALSVEHPERGVMPRLAARARESVAFSQASAAAPWTLPSLTSLLTGLLPGEHRQNSTAASMSPAPLVCFAEILSQTYGYETTVFLGTRAADGPLGIFHGFTQQHSDFMLQGAHEVLPPWAARRDRAKPFFLVLHTYECHDPYGQANHPYPLSARAPVDLSIADAAWGGMAPSEIVRRMFLDDEFRLAVRARQRSSETSLAPVQRYKYDGLARQPNPALVAELLEAYRGGAAWVDGLLDATLTQLDQLGLLENTLLAIVSDHGEAFGEHGELQHTRFLYDELVRVPMVLRGPAPFDRPRLVTESVGLIDLLPTFFDWTGMQLPGGLEGRSFLPLVRGQGVEHVVRADETRTAVATGMASHAQLSSARSSRWKYIITHELLDDTVREELYDLVADPGERENLMAAARGAPPAVDAEFARQVEQARDRVWVAGLRLFPQKPPPKGVPRPPPLPRSGP